MTHEAVIEAAASLTHQQAMDIACGIMFNGMHDKTLGPALEEALKAYLSASGMVLVPREATKDMIDAGESAASFGIGKCIDDEAMPLVWKYILKAAPNPFGSKP